MTCKHSNINVSNTMVITKWVGSHNYYLFMNFNVYIYVYPQPGLYGGLIYILQSKYQRRKIWIIWFLLMNYKTPPDISNYLRKKCETSIFVIHVSYMYIQIRPCICIWKFLDKNFPEQWNIKKCFAKACGDNIKLAIL